MKKLLIILAALILNVSIAYGASVTDFKADGTDTESDRTAFYNALYFSKDTEVTVPDGTYYIDALTIPKNKTLKAEEGAKPVIIATGSENLFTLNENSALDGLILKNGGECQNAVYMAWVTGTSVKNCVIDDFLNYGIENDHGHGMVCDNLTIRNVARGINTNYASDITVTNCYVKNCSQHGIQFWNNWEGTVEGGNLHFENNTVMDVGGGGIWGTGADGIVMRNNRVDNCGDVGLDYEMCYNGLMEDNYVSRCQNAGLALFYGCKNIVMRNNIVYNNWVNPTSDSILAGIWFTWKTDYAYDDGHENIEVYNNRIYNLDDNVNGFEYSGILIPYCVEGPRDTYIYNNVIVGNKRDIKFQRDHWLIYNERDIVIANDTITTYDKSAPDYNLVMTESGTRSIGNDGRFVSNSVTGMGRYKYVFNVSSGSSNDANLTVSVMEGDSKVVSTTLKASEITEAGVDIELICDADGAKVTGFDFSPSGSTAEMTINSIKVYRADFPFYHLLSSRCGIEYLNNSSRSLGAKVVLPYPENSYGVKGRIILNKNINYKTRDTVTISNARK